MPDRSRSILLVGATGLVGRECLRALIADPAIAHVVVIARRALSPEVSAPKVALHVVDFEELGEHADQFAVDAIICALGTTIRRAGSRTRFRHVDHDYPLAVARLGIAAGCRHFLLVSALGADAHARVFYNRVKGELEEALRSLGFPRLTIVRPSLLLGPRVELRLGEEVAKRVTRWLAPLIPRAYRPVDARAVAAVLVREAKSDAPGVRIIESAEI